MAIHPTNWEKFQTRIREGQLNEALDALRSEARRHPDLEDILTVLESRLREFQRQKTAGLLAPHEETRQHARLSADLNEAGRMLKRRAATPASRRLRHYLVVIATLCLVLAGGYWYWQQTDAERTAYRRALETNTAPACLKFLENYPDGIYHVEIRQKLGDLNRQFEQYLQSARAMRHAGELEKAREFVQKALEIYPQHPNAIQLSNSLSK